MEGRKYVRTSAKLNVPPHFVAGGHKKYTHVLSIVNHIILNRNYGQTNHFDYFKLKVWTN